MPKLEKNWFDSKSDKIEFCDTKLHDWMENCYIKKISTAIL